MAYSITDRSVLAAGEILARWEEERERSPLDRVVAAEFRSRRYLNSSERRWVSEAVYGCARHWERQKALLAALNTESNGANLARLWVDAPGTERAEDEAQTLLRLPPVADEEAIANAVANLPGTDTPSEYLRVTLSFPDALATELETLLGAEEAIQAAQAFNAQAPTTLRINPLRVSRAHVQASLPDATPTRFSPWGLELPRRVNVPDLPGFRTGWFEVQEEASQLAALLSDAQPEQTVADVGAGAGGKTLALSALMENRGLLAALDVSEARLTEMHRRAERAGVTNVEALVVGTDSEGHWQPTRRKQRRINQLIGVADVVFLDAPCTGSGALRRSPDAKWREWHLPTLIGLQQTLLQQAALLVKMEGTLIYVTCAFDRNQNEDVIAAFLESETGKLFSVVPALPRLVEACGRATLLALMPPSLRSAKSGRPAPEPEMSAELPDYTTLASGDFLRTWPHRHGLDAFFMACLQRGEG